MISQKDYETIKRETFRKLLDVQIATLNSMEFINSKTREIESLFEQLDKKLDSELNKMFTEYAVSSLQPKGDPNATNSDR